MEENGMLRGIFICGRKKLGEPGANTTMRSLMNYAIHKISISSVVLYRCKMSLLKLLEEDILRASVKW
jgi:hypothetical protein